jgi:hypothetical protein
MARMIKLTVNMRVELSVQRTKICTENSREQSNQNIQNLLSFSKLL